MKKTILKTLLILSIIGICTSVFFIAKNIYEDTRDQKTLKYNMSLVYKASAPWKGAARPKVEVVEFMDPQCESCRDFSPFVKKALDLYGEKIRLSIRYIPFHKHSRIAIEILEASRDQKKFWQTLDIIFKYQDYWGGHHKPRPKLLWRFLPEAGVDIERLKANIEKNKKQYHDIIERDFNDAKKLEIRATPAFFVNGKRLNRFSPDAFFKLIESQLNAE